MADDIQQVNDTNQLEFHEVSKEDDDETSALKSSITYSNGHSSNLEQSSDGDDHQVDGSQNSGTPQ